MATAEESTVSFPIVDSHIHLWPASETETLAWMTPEHPLAGQRSVEQFAAATGSPANLRGFVFIESDRKNGGDGQDWTHPLREVAWLRRVATGQPLPEEGHAAADARLCLGIVPWAPLHLGADQLAKYLAAVEAEAGPDVWPKVRGFRYLLQDKPHETMLSDAFIAALRVLGERGFVFDVGIDQHRRGRTQLEETVDMIDRAHEDVDEKDKVVFILNHLCKPDLTIVNLTNPSFIAWRTAMFTLSKCTKTYVKLSGLFAEMPDSLKARSADDIFEAAFPWFAVILATFGPARTMFASDWPVCAVGVGDDAWRKWRRVVERMCYMTSLSDEDQAMIWSGTAKLAYGLKLED